MPTTALWRTRGTRFQRDKWFIRGALYHLAHAKPVGWPGWRISQLNLDKDARDKEETRRFLRREIMERAPKFPSSKAIYQENVNERWWTAKYPSTVWAELRFSYRIRERFRIQMQNVISSLQNNFADKFQFIRVIIIIFIIIICHCSLKTLYRINKKNRE